MAYNDKVPDVEAPVEYAAKSVHVVGDSTPYKRHNMEGLETRMSRLEERLAATDTASVVATKTLTAVYRPDAHALV